MRIAEDRSSRKNTSFRFFFPKYFTTDRKVLISVQSGGIFIGLLRISSFFDRKQKQQKKPKKGTKKLYNFYKNKLNPGTIKKKKSPKIKVKKKRKIRSKQNKKNYKKNFKIETINVVNVFILFLIVNLCVVLLKKKSKEIKRKNY